MKVILDSSVICSDFQLQGNQFHILFSSLRQIGAKLLIPEVVVLEVVANHRKRVLSLLGEYAKLVAKASPVTGRENINSEFLKTDKLQDYEKFFRSSILSVKGIFLPLPVTPHKEILDRYSLGKKPFHNDEKGYKDFLIWQNVLGTAKSSSEPVAFISANTNDFGTPCLHEDYIADLRASGVKAKVELFVSLDLFNNKYTLPTLKVLSALADKFNKNTEKRFSIIKWANENLFSSLKESECDCAFSPLMPDHGSSCLSECKGIKGTKVNKVYLMSDDSLLIQATSDILANISISADWEDMRYEDVQEFFSGGAKFDSVSTDVEVEAKVEYSLILCGKSYTFKSVDIDKIDGTFGETSYGYPDVIK